MRKIFLALLLAAALELPAANVVTLSPSVPSPAPVGLMVTWTADVHDAGTDTLWYRFRTRRAGDDFRIVRDFGPVSALDWTASEREGVYVVEVSVQNKTTGEISIHSASFEFSS